MEAANLQRPARPVQYPDSDGEPMADNTEQYDLMVLLRENLDLLHPTAFVAANLFWYPVEGHPEVRLAPDVMVAFGRPKGRRGSYRTWDEGGVVPQVVIEIWSPANTFPEQLRKHQFYERHGVEEFILYDQVRHTLAVWVRQGTVLAPVGVEEGWASPRLGLRFTPLGDALQVTRLDGRPLRSHAALAADADAAEQKAEAAEQKAEAAEQKAEAAEQKAEAAEQKAAAALSERDALLARLRAAGIDPAKL
jgi:Uma2 family endonuclease